MGKHSALMDQKRAILVQKLALFGALKLAKANHCLGKNCNAKVSIAKFSARNKPCLNACAKFTTLVLN